MTGSADPRVSSSGSKTLIGEAFERIREDIITSRLHPGEKLRIEHLRQLYGIGTSPLREALSRLVSEGLVTTEGQRGFWVPPVSSEDYADIVETRVVLETYALRESIRRGDDEWEGRVVAAYHNLRKIEQRLTAEPENFFPDWWGRNHLFHDALIAACPLRWLLKFHGVVFDLHNRYHRISMKTVNISPDLFEDHRLLMERALERKAEEAVAVLERHIRRAPEPDSELLGLPAEVKRPRRARKA